LDRLIEISISHFTFWLRLCLVCALVTAPLNSIRAEAERRLPPQVKFKPILLSELEKLGYINSIVQDASGFIWIGAIQGLARYDGYRIKTFVHSPSDSNSLSHNWVKSLLIDDDDQLWVVTLKGLCRYIAEQDHFDCIESLGDESSAAEPPSFYSLYQDSQGAFWASTDQGIKTLNPHTRQFKTAPPAITKILPPIKDSEDNFVHEMEEDKLGNLWFALEGNGIVRYNRKNHGVTHFQHSNSQPGSLPANKIRELMIDSHGTLWVGSLGKGISRFDPKSETFTPLAHSGSEKADTVWEIMEDSDGLLWIGDGTGVHLYDPKTQEFADYNYNEGAVGGPGNFVAREMYIDNAGGIWVGYFPSGVDSIDLQASQFLNYRHTPSDPLSLADGGVLATLEDPSGNLWVGCGFGLSVLNRQSGTFSRFIHEQNNPHSLSGSTVLDMAMEKDGTLWVGAWDRGLNRKAPNSGQFTHYIYDTKQPHSLYGREPWATTIDSQGTLWVGTEKGVNRYRPETDDFERILPNDRDGNPLDSLYTRHIFEDSRGTLWIASFNGLYTLDPRSKQYTNHFKHDPRDAASISSDQILTIYEDIDGDIWVGTNGAGLNLYRPHTNNFKHYTLAEGLPNMAVSGIIDDEAGNLWLSTFKGLARFDKINQRFTVFDKQDGPLGNLYNRNSPSRLSNGEMVFGSSRGLTIFDPTKLNPNNHIPPVVITEFSVFNTPVVPSSTGPLNQSIEKTTQINLDYRQSVFSFEFAALDYRSPSENQYSYRMQGFERNWNNVGNRRTATYTNLDPGDYVFEVKASNNSGLWNEIPTTIALTIAPPFWRTPLAYFIYLLALTMALLQAIRVQRHKLSYERKKLQQERAIVKRLKEIDQMKDEINRDLDKKVAERTEELRREHERLQVVQSELKHLNRKLEDVSVTDQLTGLKNRRFLHQSIEADISHVLECYINARAPESNTTKALGDLTFLMLDLDFFKLVNDKYGHNAGDEVLAQLADILRKALRDSDYIIRWGGEEFIIVIRHLPRATVKPIVERLRQAIKHYNFVVMSDVHLTQTCSIGVATYPFSINEPTAVNWEQVINIADRALYCAKTSGRDCWVRLESSNTEGNCTQILQAIDQDAIEKPIADGQLRVSSSKPVTSLTW